jgi:hypothetical protein
MKKLIFILLSGIIAFGCEPNEELYEKLDKEKEPYNASIEYTLKAEDYSTISGLLSGRDTIYRDSIRSSSFEDGFPIKDIIPLFLTNKFPALKKESQATVHYEITPSYLSSFDKVKSFELEGDTLSGTEPDEIFPVMLEDSILPLARELTLVEMSYVYTDNYGNDSVRNSYYYLKNDTWTPLPDVYRLKDKDYHSMEGINGDYFYSEEIAAELLPVFLENKFPYAKIGESRVILYKNSDQDLTATEYILDSTGWYAKVPRSSKYLHNGDEWVFDPTVRYKLKTEDYISILRYVKNNPDIPNFFYDLSAPLSENSEYYFGASAYYSNFDTRVQNHEDYEPGVFEGLSEEKANQIIFRRIVTEAVIVALQEQFPDAVSEVDGVQVYYEITFDAYDGNDDIYTVTYKCTAAGDPPQFEYVSGNTPYDPEKD